MFSQFSGTLGGDQSSAALRAGGPRMGSRNSPGAGQMKSSPTVRLVLVFLSVRFWGASPVVPYLKTCPFQEYSGTVVLCRVLN